MTRAKKTAWRKTNRLLKRLYREGKLKFDYYGELFGWAFIESVPLKMREKSPLWRRKKEKAL